MDSSFLIFLICTSSRLRDFSPSAGVRNDMHKNDSSSFVISSKARNPYDVTREGPISGVEYHPYVLDVPLIMSC